MSVRTMVIDGPPLVIDVVDADGRHHIVSLELPPELPGD